MRSINLEVFARVSVPEKKHRTMYVIPFYLILQEYIMFTTKVDILMKEFSSTLSENLAGI